MGWGDGAHQERNCEEGDALWGKHMSMFGMLSRDSGQMGGGADMYSALPCRVLRKRAGSGVCVDTKRRARLTMAKPQCMKNTRYADASTYSAVTSCRKVTACQGMI